MRSRTRVTCPAAHSAWVRPPVPLVSFPDREFTVIKKQWIFASVATLAVFGSLAFVAQDRSEAAAPDASVAYGPEGQPIAFPHNVHAGSGEGQFQIECMYCHFSVERSSSAGIPPVSTCIGCHAYVSGQAPDGGPSPEILKVRGFWDRQEPIPWNRIYKVADHVQFPHMRHISAGVDCAACHGNVAEMGVIQTVQQPLSMGWCLTCHLEMGAPRDCTVCHY
jgi:hypothetical protein